MSALLMEKPRAGGENREEYLLEVADRIVRARKEQGLTQVELAEIVGVSQRAMQAYENAETPPYRKLKELSRVLRVSPAWILHGDEAAGEEAERLAAVERQLDDLTQAIRNLTRKIK